MTVTVKVVPPTRRLVETVEASCLFNSKDSILVQYDKSRASHAGFTFMLLHNDKRVPTAADDPEGQWYSDIPHVCLNRTEAEHFANAILDLIATYEP